MRIKVTLIVLALASLACMQQAINVTPTKGVTLMSPSPTVVLKHIRVKDTPTPLPLFPYAATVREKLAVRGGPGEENIRLRYLDPGAVVQVLELLRAADGGTWARIASGEYVNNKYLSKK